jgi:glycosyltransferase involved in cell wall biosynthesis
MLDGIVAATPHIGQRFPRSKTVVVQNFPLLDEAFPASLPYLERPPLVLYIGTINPVRGAVELVEAMGLLPETLQARLAIGGEFEPFELEQEARQKPGWKRTDYAGWQTRHGLLDLLSRARIGVIPFLPSANNTDMQPIKLFEYMLAGLPVVATKLPRISEIVKEARCGILVEPGQPKALADAFQWLLEHPAEAQAMGNRGRQAVLQTYNWNSQAQLLLDLYHRVTGSRVPAAVGATASQSDGDRRTPLVC